MNHNITRAQFLEIIKDDLPKIYALMDKFHSCRGCPQMQCCDEFRCEPCHVRHIRDAHGILSLASYWRTRDMRPTGPRGNKERQAPTKKNSTPHTKEDSTDKLLDKMTPSDWARFQNTLRQG